MNLDEMHLLLIHCIALQKIGKHLYTWSNDHAVN